MASLINTDHIKRIEFYYTFEVICERCDYAEEREVISKEDLIQELNEEGWLYEEKSNKILCSDCAESLKIVGYQTPDSDSEPPQEATGTESSTQ